MRRNPFRLQVLLPVILTAATITASEFPKQSSFLHSAYVPSYRLVPAAGAENRLGRPSMDCSPLAWDGKLREDQNGGILPVEWDQRSWFTRLGNRFDSLHYHIPLTLHEGNRWSRGSLSSSDLDYMRRLSEVWGCRIILSIGGDSADFGPVAADDESRKAFAASLQEACLGWGFDGAELDWEYPLNELEKKNYLLLIREIRSSLHPAGLSTAIAVSRWRPQEPDLYAVVDEVRIMAYDGYGKHATFESAVADVEIMAARFEIPRERVVLGIPFYGRIWKADHEAYWTGVLTYRQIARRWAPSANSDTAGDYFYNGPETVAKKARWATEASLGGVFVWEPFQDVFGDGSLISALRGGGPPDSF